MYKINCTAALLSAGRGLFSLAFVYVGDGRFKVIAVRIELPV